MKAHLLHRDRDADLRQPMPWNSEALEKDLELVRLFHAMEQGDKFISDVAKKIVLSCSGVDVDTILYRQGILRDCLNHSAVIRDLYAVAVEGAEYENKHYFGTTLMRYPNWVLRRSIELSEAFLGTIKKLRRIGDSHADQFVSEGWVAFFAMLREELGDEYLARARDHVEQLKFRDGTLLGSGLGKGNKGAHYDLLRQREQRRRGWLARLFARRPPVPGFTLDPRDESGARALAELRDRGIGAVANALAQSADHMRGFFGMLRTELAFYVGCVNLHERLSRKGEPICFPLPAAAGERRLSFRGLYDVCLALGTDRRVVGNAANADRQDLVIVTGANQGGKSTFLRSIGLAQLMMQCGMFAPADVFRSSVRDGLFTHYKREEDAGMKSGKLDEELGRMSDIVDHITPHSMVLFNESFAATNEREGSEIARQILSALSDRGVKVVCVTHLYELAHALYQRNNGNVLFLRAERQADGGRSFRLAEGEPLQTSFGEELYDGIFGAGGARRWTAD
jgi:hypothetical protein